MENIPCSIKCTICGEYKSVRKDVMKTRIEKNGSLYVLLKNYKCRICRPHKHKAKKAAKPKEEVKSTCVVSETVIDEDAIRKELEAKGEL